MAAHGLSRRPQQVGRRFGRLVAVAPSGRDARGKLLYRCACDCGALVEIRGDALSRRKSCGCIQRRTPEQLAEARREGRRRYIEKNRQKVNATGRRWYRENRQRMIVLARARRREQPGPIAASRWKSHLKSRHRMTPADYDDLLRLQDGRCAICEAPEVNCGRRRRLYVDHDHATGTVRGLLCQQCNVLLGNAQDSEDRLLAAASYLVATRAR